MSLVLWFANAGCEPNNAHTCDKFLDVFDESLCEHVCGATQFILQPFQGFASNPGCVKRVTDKTAQGALANCDWQGNCSADSFGDLQHICSVVNIDVNTVWECRHDLLKARTAPESLIFMLTAWGKFQARFGNHVNACQVDSYETRFVDN